jgi:prepilin-type N-terminal cleavage/methylation domain-containing protein
MLYTQRMSKNNTHQNKQGFTIVELLIAVVIVAILATLPVAAFSGAQQRGRDTQRVSDMNTIVKALEMYKIQTGSYPAPSTTNTIESWEVSSKSPNQFLSSLKTTGVIKAVPVDPVNNDTRTPKLIYKYYRYTAGTNGCSPARGAYYVLTAGVESSSSQLSSSPGFQCANRNWSGEAGWVTGAFTN